MDPAWVDEVRPLLEAPSPAVLTTYPPDGTASTSPVWFRWHDAAFEVVIAEGDAELRRLRRDPRCTLLVFEAVPPFRGIRDERRGHVGRGRRARSARGDRRSIPRRR